MKVLKDFGYGKSSIEQLINDQVVELNKVLTRYFSIYILEDLQMAFPILLSAGKVQYFYHLPLLWVHYYKKEALNSVSYD